MARSNNELILKLVIRSIAGRVGEDVIIVCYNEEQPGSFIYKPVSLLSVLLLKSLG